MKPFHQLETKRTFMHQLTKEDAEDFYLLNLDPQVLKYTGDQPFADIAAAEDFLVNYEQFKKYGVGRMAVVNKSSSLFLGWCGLRYDPGVQEYDIGFRFLSRYWSLGFATETAQACISAGFNELAIDRIVGRARSENIASIKVLEKIGMK
ncbi:MAG: N-acetyltransferase [Sphingobacteriales bacterium]|nr:MAG: N-acetyltransferase [Sphingobacteriales bacterium]